MTDAHSYVLVTAAYNEERHIAQLLSSILAQTVRPSRWIIVSDGSTDRTDEIVKAWSEGQGIVELLRISEKHERNFAAQVNAINRGFALLENLKFAFIGNIDADITLEPSYFERLLAKFDRRPSLGLAGGSIFERANGRFVERQGNSTSSVAHGCQLFRRECFYAVGGKYVALPYGGPDTYAEVCARMQNWQVESFRDLPVFHHRRTASVGGILRGWFRQGKMDYSLGSLPSFELIKLARRVAIRPYLLGSAARLAGFVDCYRRRETRPVSSEFVCYLRAEQRERLNEFLGFGKNVGIFNRLTGSS